MPPDCLLIACRWDTALSKIDYLHDLDTAWGTCEDASFVRSADYVSSACCRVLLVAHGCLWLPLAVLLVAHGCLLMLLAVLLIASGCFWLPPRPLDSLSRLSLDSRRRPQITIPFSASTLGPRNGAAALDMVAAAVHVTTGASMMDFQSGVGFFNPQLIVNRTASLHLPQVRCPLPRAP